MIDYAAFLVNGYDDLEKPVVHDALYVIATPSMNIDSCRAKMKPGSLLFAYVDAVVIVTKPGTNPYYLNFQKAMHYEPPYEAFWKDAQGVPINFETPTWPTARIVPKNKYADWFVDYCVTSGVLRSFDGVYLDEFTKQIPDWVFKQKLGIQLDDPRIPQWQTDHAHYINRIASGLRARMDPSFKIIANSATFTHPALDAITVEVKQPGESGGTPRPEAISACKNQKAHGMDRAQCVLWGDEGAPGSAIAGKAV